MQKKKVTISITLLARCYTYDGQEYLWGIAWWKFLESEIAQFQTIYEMKCVHRKQKYIYFQRSDDFRIGHFNQFELSFSITSFGQWPFPNNVRTFIIGTNSRILLLLLNVNQKKLNSVTIGKVQRLIFVSLNIGKNWVDAWMSWSLCMTLISSCILFRWLTRCISSAYLCTDDGWIGETLTG